MTVLLCIFRIINQLTKMECSLCGGYVEWKGPLTALTHTECHGCGAVNSQTPEDEECRECDGTGAIDSGGVTPWGAGIDIPCPRCSSLHNH
jgi:DnaJ-class molecular chaperone